MLLDAVIDPAKSVQARIPVLHLGVLGIVGVLGVVDEVVGFHAQRVTFQVGFHIVCVAVASRLQKRCHKSLVLCRIVLCCFQRGCQGMQESVHVGCRRTAIIAYSHAVIIQLSSVACPLVAHRDYSWSVFELGSDSDSCSRRNEKVLASCPALAPKTCRKARGRSPG